ncbi:MAG TPA: HEAT repeat domain-containing protein [Planctomycetota bacterium]|nr:HEAT repeat domain-containing protein [Planctomycetota bacterium]
MGASRSVVAGWLACVFSLALCAGEDDLDFNILNGRPVGPVKLPAGAVVFTGPGDEMGKLSLSRDGKVAAGAGKDGRLHLFDVAQGKLRLAINAEIDEVKNVAFAPDGKSVFTCGEEGVHEWDAADGKAIRKFEGHTGPVSGLAISANGALLASTDSVGIHIWDLKTGTRLGMLTGHKVPGEAPGATLSIDAVAFSADGRVLVSEANDETARLWDVLNGRELRTLPNHDGSVAALALSPDGSLGISTRGSRQQWMQSEEDQPGGGRLRVWEVATGRVLRTLVGHKADITCVAFSADGRYVWSGGNDRTVRQWEVDSGVELRRFRLVSTPVGIVAAPGGKFVVSLSASEGIVVWDLSKPPLTVVANANPGSADDAWQKLASPQYDDRAAAFAFYIAQGPAGAADLIRRLREMGAVKDDDVAALIEKLDDPNFQLRANAAEELSQRGIAARPALLTALRHPSLEVRIRAASLLAQIGGIADFRTVTAIEVLGQLGGADATAELSRLASANMPWSRQARGVLQRLK